MGIDDLAFPTGGEFIGPRIPTISPGILDLKAPLFHGTSSLIGVGQVISSSKKRGVRSTHAFMLDQRFLDFPSDLEYFKEIGVDPLDYLNPGLTTHAFATQDIEQARNYARKATRYMGGEPMVYRVEPVNADEVFEDEFAPDNVSWRAEDGFRVISPAETHSGRSAVEFANGDMKYAEDGRSYFLHHSPTSGIKVGDQIRTTGVAGQTTAGDAIFGHSYAWDARTGVRDSLSNQVSMRSYSDGAGVGTRDFSVYLTSANTSETFPDINVPGTSARAIRGTQDVLEEIKIPAHLTNDEAQELIRQTIARRGISESKRGRKKGNRLVDDGGKG
jgi:hypothetical protein